MAETVTRPQFDDMAEVRKRLWKSTTISFDGTEEEPTEVVLTAGYDIISLTIANCYVRGSPKFREFFSWDSMTHEEAQALIDVLQFFVDRKDG